MKLLLVSAEDIFDKALQLQKSAMKCALNDPFNFFECFQDEMAKLSPTATAVRDIISSEFDITPEDILIDGIVVDEERAKSTPCKCIKFHGKDLCWSPGIIGLLRQDQISKYCPTKIYEHKPKLEKHLEEFKRIAEYTRGMPLLERIELMRKVFEEEKEKGKEKKPVEKPIEVLTHPEMEIPPKAAVAAEEDVFESEDEVEGL